MKVAGLKRTDDWARLKTKLLGSPSLALWEEAYKDFFYERVKTRYLDPITSIQQHDQELGEGFAIVALVCTLIEFLEGCETGKNFNNDATTRKPNEYGRSEASGLFKDFLVRPPFKELMPSHLVGSFYRDVRCGLLHEARSCGGWTISTEESNGVLVSEMGGVIKLYRNELVRGLERYFDDYHKRLLSVQQTQAAFIAKFDHLCEP